MEQPQKRACANEPAAKKKITAPDIDGHRGIGAGRTELTTRVLKTARQTWPAGHLCFLIIKLDPMQRDTEHRHVRRIPIATEGRFFPRQESSL